MDRPLFRRLTIGTMQLTTQQLRLRNLTKIEGVNITVSDSEQSGIGLIYYTLHQNKDAPSFYTSEALPQHVQQKWAEIVCPAILKSNKNCVCVKVWLRTLPIQQTRTTTEAIESTLTERQIKESYSALDALRDTHTSSSKLLRSPADKLLFSWGVYFSGLAMINQKTDIQFNENALIFQMNGAEFSSPDYFFVSKVWEQSTPVYQRTSGSANISSSPDPFLINSPRESRSSSPVIGDGSINTLSSKSVGRIFQINCRRTDVRRSYDLDKLLRLQEIQRQRMKMLRQSADIAGDIKRQSVFCITADQLNRTRSISSSYSSASHSHQNQHYHSIGRKLSILLAEEERIEPALLLRAQKLRRELETLHFRHGLLVNEQKTFRDRTEDLQSRLSTITAARIQLQQCLEAKALELEREKTALAEQWQHHSKRLQVRRHIVQNVEKRMSTLCLELQEIYPISRNDHGFYTICGVPVPSLDMYGHGSRHSNGNNSEQISPLALSASLGYVAHLVQMISVIIDQPLRNPIIHEGSRSRVQDTIKEVPYAPKDYPLYSRSLMPSKFVKYALFLLNQNIVQLCYDITGIHSDLRATMENLIHIFRAFSDIEQSLHEEVRPLMRTHPNNRCNVHTSHSNGSIKNQNLENLSTDDIDGLGQSLSSIDEHSVLSQPPTTHLSAMLLRIPKASQPLPIAEHKRIERNMNLDEQRVSRSMDSYSDGESHIFKDIGGRSYSNSDSNIAFRSKKI